ncbi:DUF4405 domain-containing protein [Gilvimarinus sp. SDUM040013]|uniref:DUF4405 domain-containing protein n=1 Tax=Gilvimarinus gilvus TaxID=3058038 RepID=A0ABU4RSY7_9GAMM|nr:DUF4405 domain-containing protein [Gilvimarinus sp. SDUM040013]MDO3388224.1 DUF4405 domain-containing protein [Gilvimarinus sp. SDUM040013]MDX6847774.1 DUF4405 domain-containing protein [Gilvimarinus sp. SDUM040013]
MNIRSATTITISIVFITLMTTGILLYALPWSYFVGAIHIWASIFFIIGTGLHFKNNLKVYLSHLSKRAGKKTLVGCGVGFLIVVVGLMLALPPFATVMETAETLRKRGLPETSEYTLTDLTGDTDLPKLNLFLKAGSAYESEPQPVFWTITYTSIPQVAVWMETLDGQYIDTLYVTGKVSNSGFGETDAGPTRRPEALPYWSHSRGIQEADGYYAPVNENADLDGVSGATPQSDSFISLTAPRMGEYRLLVEVNRSYDFNEYYSKDRFPEDPIYSGDGSSGQPSLVYATTIDSNESRKYLLDLIGRGHHSGADGELYTDLENISTAKDILSFIVADVE